MADEYFARIDEGRGCLIARLVVGLLECSENLEDELVGIYRLGVTAVCVYCGRLILWSVFDSG